MSSQTSEISDRVAVALENNPHLAGRGLRVHTEAGKVILRGHVGSYFEKQMAQESVKRIEGVEAIDNDLEVTW